MAAYAALFSLSQTADLFLNYYHKYFSPQVKDQILSINEYVISLRWFLEHFPDKANSLEAIIRDVTHVAEDIVELFTLENIYEPRYTALETFDRQPDKVKDISEQSMWKSFVVLLESLSRPFKLPDQPKAYLHFEAYEQSMWKSFAVLLESLDGPLKLTDQPKAYLHFDFHDLREATEEIQSIAEMVMKMKSRIMEKDERSFDSTAVNSSSSSSSRVAPAPKDFMFGFENDSMEIKSRLCGESSKLEVIPILGMGGIGKTTLARNIYDDRLTMDHFQIRAWVTVSQDYSVKEIVSFLLTSMNIFDAKSESMGAEQVYKNLKGRRYLIVLDDLWSTKAWDDLKQMFPDDGNKSRIMITTRLSDVATYADSDSPVHVMRQMDKDLSWELLKHKVFKKGKCPIELEYVGRVIARSCKGLPLAIVVISGILSSIDHTAAAWESIARNVRTIVSADKILSLSYTHLPLHLKPCFLYMGSFQRDYVMRVSKLVKLWAAEGFLKPNGCNNSFEETAMEYLEDLVKRSLVSVVERKHDGRIKSLSMHDLMREMCIRIAQEEKFLRHGLVSLRQGLDIVHHASTIPSHPEDPGNFYGLTFRTVLLSGRVHESAFFCLKYFRLLRVLDLLDIFATVLPPQVLELFHLRYLAFYGSLNSGRGLSNLPNLQSLIIYSHSSFEYLPYFEDETFPFLLEIWSMPQLRHLVIRSGFRFHLPPNKSAGYCLQNLQTLSLAINFVCTWEILEAIPNLKKLAIWYMYRDDEDDYHLHNLVYLNQLENLKVKIDSRFPSLEKINLVFPSTLKKLSLTRVGLPWKDMKIVASLRNLEVLKLRDYACDGETWETNEGEFSQLKFLLIDGSHLLEWITESSHFPKLVRVVLHRCPNLREIPNEIGDVPTLEMIEVDDKDLFKSAKQIQEDQQSYGNEALQVRFVEVVPMQDPDTGVEVKF